MEEKISLHFDRIVKFAQDRLEAVRIIVYEIFPDYGVLKLKGKIKGYTIKITEVMERKRRKYSYYLLLKDKVVRGYDNAADPRVIKLKWKDGYKNHLNELTPHMHTEEKKEFILTDEVFCENVLQEFEQIALKEE